MSHQRQKSERLITTTPDTRVGAALASIKPRISPKLLEGLEIRKVSSNGAIAPRILTLSDDLFTIFVSHHKVGNKESLADRFHYRGFKAYSKVVSTVLRVEQGSVLAKHHLRVIDVSDILFVQSGFVGSRKLEVCKEKNPDSLDASQAISIFHNNVTTTDFLVECEEDRQAVLGAIQMIREAYHAAQAKVGREELLLRYAWYDTDVNKSGLIDEGEFLQLLGRINIYLKQEKATKIFKTYLSEKIPDKGSGRIGGGTKQRHGITFDECLYILRYIQSQQGDGKRTSDVIFDETFGAGKDRVTAEEFLTKFLHEKQNERSATINDVKKIFSDINSIEISGATDRLKDDGKGDDGSIDRVRFGEFLFDSRNDLYDPERQTYDPTTLTSPLSHYWINSSHNTYLTGDQLKSLSSVEMYAVAMQRGCKCLEIDCWNGEEVPVVYHGFTLTSKIPFEGIITCVRGYLDANPETLPIVLSLENHCSHPFQEQMAEILNRELGERLYVPENSDHLPSPLELRGKVVIKGKRPETLDDVLTSAESMEEDGGDFVEGKKPNDAPLPKIVPELARLTLLNGVKFKHFETSMEAPLSDMHSFSEAKVIKVLNHKSLPHWKEYNNDHMSRTYPAGSRVDSSNYNPVLAWHVGAQLVALNYQTDDSAMNINAGRFLENGGCGYIRKPPSVLEEESSLNRKMSLRIKVLSGSCLPKPYGESMGEVIDPYVVVRLHDVVDNELDGSNESAPSSDKWLETVERKTSSVRDNGFCPQWKKDTECFQFQVNEEDVAMLEFVVVDSDQGFIDDKMCKSAVPVSCLRQGYRSVQFYDHSSQHGPYSMARILVEVDIKYIV